MLRHCFTASCALIITTGCQTVDLNQQTIQPNCAVSASDYKLLHEWDKRTNDDKYSRVIDALEKKYAAAPKVDGRSAVVAAQSYVRSNAGKSPELIEAAVKTRCN